MAELPKDEPEVSSAFCLGGILRKKKRFSMAMGRIKHIRLALLIGISLIIPLLLAYSLYIDLSETTLLSSDMSFEDPEDEDLSICQGEVEVFVGTISSDLSPPWTYFSRDPSLFLSPCTCHTQTTPILRC